MTRSIWLSNAMTCVAMAACQSAPSTEHTSSGSAGASGETSSGGAEPETTGGTPATGGTSPQSPDLWAECDHVPVVEKCRDSWCEIPPGCVVVGSPETEGPRRAAIQEDQVLVTLSRPFIIQQTEVTQGEWEAKGFANPSGTQPNGKGDCLDDPRCPVGRVTWFEVLTYANRLSSEHDPPLEECYVLHGCQGTVGVDFYCTAAEVKHPTVYECQGFRLPTNAEWEYAARARTRTAFYSGDIAWHQEFENNPDSCLPDPNLERIAWYCHSSGGKTHPVGQLESNGWGLFDMLGNAEEWNNDRADGRPLPPGTDPGGTVGLHTNRNTRGGSFVSLATVCRVASRLGGDWNLRSVGLGFRLVRTGTLDDL